MADGWNKALARINRKSRSGIVFLLGAGIISMTCTACVTIFCDTSHDQSGDLITVFASIQDEQCIR